MNLVGIQKDIIFEKDAIFKSHEQEEFKWDHEQIWPPKEYGFACFFMRRDWLFQAELFKSLKAELTKEEN